MMSLAMSRRPDWVEQLTGKMNGIPEVRKQQLLDLTSSVHVQAVQRAADQAGLELGEFTPSQPAASAQVRPVEGGRAEVAPPKRLPARGPVVP